MGSFRLAAALLAAGLAAAPAAVTAKDAGTGRFDRLVVFGDSLSDSGNAGRFSDGPVWVEQLAGFLDLSLAPARLGGGNFAVGGARLDPQSGPINIRAQADLHLRAERPADGTLYVVFGGGNDLLAAVGSPAAEAMVDAAAASLADIVADLAAGGATDILVPNLPDIGMTPTLLVGDGPTLEEAGRLTERFNAAAAAALAELAARPELNLYRLDLRAMAARARADPASFGFDDVTHPCSGLPSCDGYLFWDGIHPTTEAHARLAEAAFRLLQGEPPIPPGPVPDSG